MKLGIVGSKILSTKSRRLAAVFAVLSGLLITVCIIYGPSGFARGQGPQTRTQQPNRKGRAIRGSKAKPANGGKTVQGCFPPPAGLVSWYRAEGDAKDFTSSNDGSISGTLSFVPGKVGQAFDFTGAGGITIPDSASLRPTALTI